MAGPKPSKGWASLLSKIHPPLPLNPRESQQLANAVSKSFREHLDKEHPTSNAGVRGHSDAHISSILTNPHFSRPNLSGPGSDEPIRPRSASAEKGFGVLERLQNHLVNEEDVSGVQWFRTKAAAGEATLATARECLLPYGSIRIAERALLSPKFRTSPEWEGPGRVVANWLWSTGLEESLEFIHDLEFTRLLVRAMAAEGQLKRVRGWVDRSFALLSHGQGGSNSSASDVSSAVSQLFCHYLWALENHGGPNQMLQTFLQIVHSQNIPEVTTMACGKAARALASKLSSTGLAAKVDVELYDSMWRTLPRLMTGRLLLYRRAWMALKHPKHPNPDLALEFSRLVNNGKPGAKTFTQHEQAILFHRELAGLLAAQGRHNEAKEVLHLLDVNTSPRLPTAAAANGGTRPDSRASSDVMFSSTVVT